MCMQLHKFSCFSYLGLCVCVSFSLSLSRLLACKEPLPSACCRADTREPLVSSCITRIASSVPGCVICFIILCDGACWCLFSTGPHTALVPTLVRCAPVLAALKGRVFRRTAQNASAASAFNRGTWTSTCLRASPRYRRKVHL